MRHILIEPIKNGYDYRDFIAEGTPYIRVGDVRNGWIDPENAAKVSITPNEVSKNVQLQSGGILFIRKGSFGNAAVVRPEQCGAIISSEIMLLRIRPELQSAFLPDYLVLYLNSQFDYLQVEQRVHGVGYYSISQADLGAVEIIVPPVIFQQQIVNKVRESISLEKQSNRLLDIAKRGVELAIEQDEAAATAWMQAQKQNQ